MPYLVCFSHVNRLQFDKLVPTCQQLPQFCVIVTHPCIFFQVIKCTEELEARAKSSPTLELYTMYCSNPPTDQVNDLRQKFNESSNNIDLSKYSPVCIASVLKKFLRELPDPVIPVQWYDHFVEASSKNGEFNLDRNCIYQNAYVFFAEVRSDEQCANLLSRLVQEIPEHHRLTLSFLMSHLCRICEMEHARGNRNPPTVLVQVMSHIFLRPPWERIM